MKLTKKDLCLECSTYAMFSNSSFTVSMMALFLDRILSETLMSAPFHVASEFSNKLCPVHEEPLEKVLADVSLVPDGLPVLNSTNALYPMVCGH